MKRKTAKLTGPKTFEFFLEDLPELKPDEILIKRISVGLCHSGIPAYICGFMGLLTIAGLKNDHLGSLTAVDLMDRRLAMAGEYGADHMVNPAKESLNEAMMELTKGKGFDVIVEITGSLKGLASALSISRIRGRGKILLPSMYTKNEVFTQKMAYHMMYRFPILHVVHPWYCEDYMGTLEKAVEAYKKGIFPTGRLITHRIPFEEISRGFELLEKNPEEYVKDPAVCGDNTWTEDAGADQGRNCRACQCHD